MHDFYTVTEIARSRLERIGASAPHGLLVSIANCCRHSRLVQIVKSTWGRTSTRCVNVHCA